MTLLSRIAERFLKSESSQAMLRFLPFWTEQFALSLFFDAKRMAESGYRKNVIVFACVSEIASSLSQAPIVASKLGREGEVKPLPQTHPLSRLLQTPNQRQSQQQFIEKLATMLESEGNAYVWKQRASSGLPVALRLLRPDLVKIRGTVSGTIKHYEYTPDVQEQIIPPEDVIHCIDRPDPLDEYYGISPIAVAARDGDLDNYATEFLRTFFLRAGIPAGLLKANFTVKKEQVKEIQKEWSHSYGQDASGSYQQRVGVIHGGHWEYENIGITNREMSLDAIFGHTETRICAAFQVPPILIGSWIGLLRSTYANYDAARKSYYSETLAPKWTKLATTLTHGLASEFGEDLVILPDLSGVKELREDRTLDRAFALDGWNSQLITRNQALGLSGMELIKGDLGNEYKPASTGFDFGGFEEEFSRGAAPARLRSHLKKAPLLLEEAHASKAVPEFRRIRGKGERRLAGIIQELFAAQSERAIAAVKAEIIEGETIAP